jgi:hypothetical protein
MSLPQTEFRSAKKLERCLQYHCPQRVTQCNCVHLGRINRK